MERHKPVRSVSVPAFHLKHKRSMSPTTGAAIHPFYSTQSPGSVRRVASDNSVTELEMPSMDNNK